MVPMQAQQGSARPRATIKTGLIRVPACLETYRQTSQPLRPRTDSDFGKQKLSQMRAQALTPTLCQPKSRGLLAAGAISVECKVQADSGVSSECLCNLVLPAVATMQLGGPAVDTQERKGFPGSSWTMLWRGFLEAWNPKMSCKVTEKAKLHKAPSPMREDNKSRRQVFR